MSVDDYRRWFYSEHEKLINQKKLPIYKQLLMEYSNVARLGTMKILKLALDMSTTNTIITTYKASRGDLTIIYGFLYSMLIQDKEKVTKLDSSQASNDQIAHKYVCLGQSLISRDGEYRNRLNIFGSFLAIKKHFIEQWEDIEEYMLAFIKGAGFMLYNEFYYPSERMQQKYSDLMESSLASSRLDIHFLIGNWFGEVLNYYMGFKTGHINPVFAEIFGFKDREMMSRHMDFIGRLIKDHGHSKIYDLWNKLNCYFVPANVSSQRIVKLGQKLIPLNYSEYENPFNIFYKPWREYLIAQRIQGLFLSGICFNIPLMADYFMVSNTKKTLYDNEVQVLKLEHSEQAKVVVGQLQTAQRSTFKEPIIAHEREPVLKKPTTKKGGKVGKAKVINKNVKKIDKVQDSFVIVRDSNALKSINESQEGPESYDVIEEWLSRDFKVLHAKINDPIEFARQEIIMSDSSLGVFSEYVGRTVYNAFGLCKSSETFHKFLGQPLVNHEIFDKYMFEIVYALHCINRFYGVMHGDLHLNNATIGPNYFTSFLDPSKLANPRAVFIVSQADSLIFNFPTNQYTSKLIDFSRAIIKLDDIDRFRHAECRNVMRDQIPILTDRQREQMHQEQVARILWMYENSFPEFYGGNKERLREVIGKHFEQLFPIISTFDTFTFFNNMLLMFEKRELKPVKQIALLQKVTNAAEDILVNRMTRLLGDDKLFKVEELFENGNLSIMSTCFENYLTTLDKLGKSKDTIDVIDISNCDNEIIKYSLDEFKDFPPYLQTNLCISPEGKKYPWPGNSGPIPQEMMGRKKYEEFKLGGLREIVERAQKYKGKLIV